MKRHTGRSRKNSKTKNNDYLVRIISVQITISLLVFLTALAYSKLGGDSFQEIVSEYKRLTKEDIGIEEIKSALSDKGTESGEDGVKESQLEIPSFLEDEDEDGEQTSLSDSRKAISDATLSPLSLSTFNRRTTASILQSLIKEEPVLPLENTKISSAFGQRIHPITKKPDFHKGTDFVAREGERVRAVLDGVVTKTGTGGSQGTYIILQHKNNIETYYYHNSKLLIKEGTVVRAGESIALAGSTGESTGPHVHLEVRINGEPVDPMKSLFTDHEL